MNQQPVQLDFVDLIDALEALEGNRESYRAYTRAQRTVKQYVPFVDTPTRFQVGEDFTIDVNPMPRDGYDVKPGIAQMKAIQRTKGAQ